MGNELLVTEQIQAGADFLRDFNDHYPVSVACWLNPAESDNSYLYIASDKIDETNIDVAYGEVLRQLQAERSLGLDPFRVRLLNSSDPIASDAIRIRDRFPARIPTRYDGSSIGGMSIESAYIYPSLSVANTVV
jgi:hypothetical protein